MHYTYFYPDVALTRRKKTGEDWRLSKTQCSFVYQRITFSYYTLTHQSLYEDIISISTTALFIVFISILIMYQGPVRLAVVGLSKCR